jgi:hypothetical protein
MAMALEDDVKALFVALPVSGVNQPGKTARNALVGRVKGATPGRATTPYSKNGPLFRDLFCPNYRAAPFEGAVDSVTGLGNAFWQDLAVSIMCEAMWNVTSRLRPQILIGNAQSDINNRNSQIFHTGSNWYAYVLPLDPGAVKTAFDQIPAASRNVAQAIYIDALKSPEWITAKRAAFVSGQWTDRSWELFHHWVKLQCLGASKATIDSVIDNVIGQQLPVPTDVDARNWQSYRAWAPDNLSWKDVQGDASAGMLREVCYVYIGNDFPSCMQESYSFEFTANSQPGNKYRQPPNSSCFGAGAMVVMADRSRKPIAQVRTGDHVLTPSGKGKVLLVSAPLRASRPLYSFAGFGFQFTNTQPFVTYQSLYVSTAPRLACIAPLRLIDAVPTLSLDGVVGLAPPAGTQLGKLGPVSLEPFTVPPIAEHAPSAESDRVYELIVHAEGYGICDYFVGDAGIALLVSPEIPSYRAYPEATEAILLTLEGCAESVLAAIAQAPDADVSDVLQVGMASVAGLLLPNVLRLIAAAPDPDGAGGDPQPEPRSTGHLARLEQKVQGLIARLDGAAPSDPATINRLSSLYATLIEAFGIQYAGALDLGWRIFRYVEPRFGTVLSVSAYSVELDGSIVLPAGTPISLEIALGYADQEFVRRLPASPPPKSGYYYGFQDVAYFDVWRDGAQTPLGWTVRFTVFRDDTGETLGITASADLPAELEGGFRMAGALVLDPTGRQSGRINYDLRVADEATYDLEQVARHRWTPAKRLELAQALGAAGGKYIAKRFPPAVHLFSITCSYQSTTVYPPPPARNALDLAP